MTQPIPLTESVRWPCRAADCRALCFSSIEGGFHTFQHGDNEMLGLIIDLNPDVETPVQQWLQGIHAASEVAPSDPAT